MKANSKTLNLTLSALFIALIIIAGTVLNIKLPGNLPNLSTQFFFCALAGVFLGSKLGGASVLIYVIIGLCGLPVFTQGGGIYYVFKPSFGYIVGYIFCALIMGYAAQKWGDRFVPLLIAAFISLLVLYTFGTVYLYLILNLYLNVDTDVFKALQMGVLPFVITDSIWCVLIAVCGSRLKRLIIKTNKQ